MYLKNFLEKQGSWKKNVWNVFMKDPVNKTAWMGCGIECGYSYEEIRQE